jgi:hypothetical protein
VSPCGEDGGGSPDPLVGIVAHGVGDGLRESRQTQQGLDDAGVEVRSGAGLILLAPQQQSPPVRIGGGVEQAGNEALDFGAG